MRILSLLFVLLYSIVTISVAAPPDLTAGGVPNEDPPITINLGPTGARGWVYHVKSDTSESRQILVTTVYYGSPAAGILETDDVILGADGTGSDPNAFSSDARKSLALAIADAEARSPATLKLLRWRSGTTSTVTLTLQTMGAYSATAPYNCPKSTKILEEGLQYVYQYESAGRYLFGAITLLANGNSTYQARAQYLIRKLIPPQYTIDKMMSDQRDSTSMVTWERGHTLIILAEYYLATGDSEVLPAIEAYAVNIAKNTSLFGTVGHIFADKNKDGSPNGPMGGVYGVVNTPGLFCFLGVLLAKECGLTNPVLDPAIERASRFFAYYSGKGAIPYGEHEPGSNSHESNGKCGLSALTFMLQENRVEEGKFFAKMSTASANEREFGHTGAFFNYLWAPLGAAVGGEEAAVAHFSRISWMLDLNRRWNGSFDYDCLNGQGPNSGSQYNDFRMSTAALLTYALPLRKLYITGKGHDSSRWLSSADVAEAIAADDYDSSGRTVSELIADLENWSPKVRKEAGNELGTRSISTSELSQITALANNASASSGSRAGACYALGQIGNSSSAAVLAILLTDSDNYVRFMAAEAMRYMPSSSKLSQLNSILTAADTTNQSLFPLVEEDPLHFAHGKLAMLLFYSGSAYGPKGVISGSGINDNSVDRNLLYPAIDAVSRTPVGLCRSTLKTTYENLSYDDMLAVSGSIVDSITNRAPADKMFSAAIRDSGVKTFQKFGIAEGVPACMLYAADEVKGKRKPPLELLGTFGGGIHTVMPDPCAVPFLESYLSDSVTAATAQASLDEIASDTNPTTLIPLKSIQFAAADSDRIALPNNSTILRVSASDHANGDSVYTWRKLLGLGQVTFTPNGTSAAAVSTVQFDGTPGIYKFEVTMSDSRGLTEVYESIMLQLSADGEFDNTAPTPNPAAFAVAPTADNDTSISMTATTGTDDSGVVEYLFTETSGNSGGTTSQWQASPTYTDTGLSPDTTYTYTVTMRDVLLNTGAPSAKTSVNTFPPAISCQLGVMDFIKANNGINPATMQPWQVGDQYRLAFVTSQKTNATSTDIATYNAFVQGLANTAGLEGANWKVIGSTGTVDARDNTGTNPTVDGDGFATFLIDGVTKVSDNNADMWDGDIDAAINMTEDGSIYANEMFTGSDKYGRKDSNRVLGGSSEDPPLVIIGHTAYFSNKWIVKYSRLATGTRPVYALSDPLTVQNEVDPPNPNPAAFAIAPTADSDTSISMTATVGRDFSGPVEYLFTEISGNPGGTSSSWQTSPSYTDNGLTLNLQYTYTVTMRDAFGNTGNPSAAASALACYVDGDFNADCKVDLLDLAELAMGWLSAYDMSDLAVISQNWLVNEE